MAQGQVSPHNLCLLHAVGATPQPRRLRPTKVLGWAGPATCADHEGSCSETGCRAGSGLAACTVQGRAGGFANTV